MEHTVSGNYLGIHHSDSLQRKHGSQFRAFDNRQAFHGSFHDIHVLKHPRGRCTLACPAFLLQRQAAPYMVHLSGNQHPCFRRTCNLPRANRFIGIQKKISYVI